MKIGYIETFPLLGKDRWQKIPLETETIFNIQIDATDEEIEEAMVKVRRIQYALKKQVQSFFYESNAAAEKQMGTQETEVGVQKAPIKSQEETIIEGINSCTELKVLQSYELIAKKNPQFKEAYDNKLKSLKK